MRAGACARVQNVLDAEERPLPFHGVTFYRVICDRPVGQNVSTRAPLRPNWRAIDCRRSFHSHVPNTSCAFCNGEQLDGVAVVHVNARTLERAAQRDDAGIHVTRNLVGGLEDVAHRHAFHRRGVVAHADQVADRAAAPALAVVRRTAARQDGSAALSEQMADCAVVDFLFAEILRLHVLSPDPRLQASPIRFTSDFRPDVASDVAQSAIRAIYLGSGCTRTMGRKGPECKSFYRLLLATDCPQRCASQRFAGASDTTRSGRFGMP